MQDIIITGGSDASLYADLVLLAYVLVLTPGMLLGFYFARRKMFIPHHKWVMTAIVIINWALILSLMLVSYSKYVAPSLSYAAQDVRLSLPLIHMVTGGIAQLLGTYLVILMWTERTRYERLLPFRIRRIKTPMRITLGLWLMTVLLGVGIFLTSYPPDTASASLPPVATEEAAEEAADEAADESAQPVATDEAADESAQPVATDEADG